MQETKFVDCKTRASHGWVFDSLDDHAISTTLDVFADGHLTSATIRLMEIRYVVPTPKLLKIVVMGPIAGGYPAGGSPICQTNAKPFVRTPKMPMTAALDDPAEAHTY